MGPQADVAVTLVDERVVMEHTCAGGERVAATLNNAEWYVVRVEPLDVEPSVSCDRCGLHGWITGGQFWGLLATPERRALGTPEVDR